MMRSSCFRGLLQPAMFTLSLLLTSCKVPATSTPVAQPTATVPSTHEALVQLFQEWREFERPPLREGAPDYTVEGFAAAEHTF